MYSKWRSSAVTKRLFEDLELAVINSFQDYLPENSRDGIVIQSMLRQGEMAMVEQVLDWKPTGLEDMHDED